MSDFIKIYHSKNIERLIPKTQIKQIILIPNTKTVEIQIHLKGNELLIESFTDKLTAKRRLNAYEEELK